jgi:hypothetical protein
MVHVIAQTRIIVRRQEDLVKIGSITTYFPLSVSETYHRLLNRSIDWQTQVIDLSIARLRLLWLEQSQPVLTAMLRKSVTSGTFAWSHTENCSIREQTSVDR